MFFRGCWTRLRGYRLTAGGSMVTAEYNWKQFELLLTWAMATTNPNLKAKLLLRAIEFLALVDDTDERALLVFQEVIDEFKAQLLRKP